MRPIPYSGPDPFERMLSALETREYDKAANKLAKLNVRELRVLMAHYGRPVKYASDWPKAAMIEVLVQPMQSDPNSPLYIPD